MCGDPRLDPGEACEKSIVLLEVHYASPGILRYISKKIRRKSIELTLLDGIA